MQQEAGIPSASFGASSGSLAGSNLCNSRASGCPVRKFNRDLNLAHPRTIGCRKNKSAMRGRDHGRLLFGGNLACAAAMAQTATGIAKAANARGQMRSK